MAKLLLVPSARARWPFTLMWLAAIGCADGAGSQVPSLADMDAGYAPELSATSTGDSTPETPDAGARDAVAPEAADLVVSELLVSDAGAAGTSAASSVEAAADAPIKRTVAPHTTDPAINNPNNDHVIFVPPPSARNGKLLVYLTGTNGKPANVTLFLETAAQAGYMTIGLDYPNKSAASACGADLNCYGTWRLEVFQGGDSNPRIAVSPANSIRNRLIKLLQYLAAQYPDEEWAEFLTNGQPRYPRIAFGGNSQGGGHAAWIARQHEVARVLMFSSVCDAANGSPPKPATWVTRPHVTPVARYYGFDHTNDEFAAKVAVTWRALGLNTLGPRTSVDGADAPFGGSHQLTTSRPEPDPMVAHTLIISNGTTPIVNGQPLYRNVWLYMLTH